MSSPERVVMERITPLIIHKDGFKRYLDIDSVLERLHNNTLSSEYMDTLNEEVQEFAKNILQSGLTHDEVKDIIYDVTWSNIGIKNNKLLILDYGLIKNSTRYETFP